MFEASNKPVDQAVVCEEQWGYAEYYGYYEGYCYTWDDDHEDFSTADYGHPFFYLLRSWVNYYYTNYMLFQTNLSSKNDSSQLI